MEGSKLGGTQQNLSWHRHGKAQVFRVPQLPYIDPNAQLPNDAVDLLASKEDKAAKGVANGYAPLDSNAKVPVANLPDQASLDAEVDGKISTHNSATTNVHGITNTANLVLTDDARLTNARTPTAHTHAVADVTGLQAALDGKQASGNYAPATGISPTAITGTAVVTADSRLSDARTPTSHTHGNITNAGAIGSTANLPLITTTSGVVTTGAFGNTENSFCQGNDLRLSDARTPTAHTHAISDVTNLQTELNNKQASGTYATLVGGKVPSDQLPSYVDDVLEFADNSAFPAAGETGKIYVSLATNKTFRWSGSAYVEISPSEVTSVNTKTGAVTLTASDVGAAPSSGISPTAISGTAVITTDPRLSDARTPTSHSHPASEISNSTTAGRALLTASTVQAQRTALDIFVVAANLAAFPASGNFQRSYIAQDTGKLYGWSGSGYFEISPNTHTRAGGDNTNLGETALSSASLSGSNNTAVGAYALQGNTTGNSNTANGVNALQGNTTGNSNTANGVNALQDNTVGSNNSAVGANALRVGGNNNSAVGAYALELNSGHNNSALGAGALQYGVGSNNSAVGTNALRMGGHKNSAVGANALFSNLGSNNSALGAGALQSNDFGSNNSAVGANALFSNTSGNNNSAFGEGALLFNTTGGNNSAFGFSALRKNLEGQSNCAFGINALYNATGDNNSAVGRDAGERITTGIENTLLGSLANVDTNARSRCVVLGYATTSPAVNGSLAIGGSGAAAMGGLTTSTAPTGASTYLRIWLNGVEYRITAVAA